MAFFFKTLEYHYIGLWVTDDFKQTQDETDSWRKISPISATAGLCLNEHGILEEHRDMVEMKRSLPWVNFLVFKNEVSYGQERLVLQIMTVIRVFKVTSSCPSFSLPVLQDVVWFQYFPFSCCGWHCFTRHLGTSIIWG